MSSWTKTQLAAQSVRRWLHDWLQCFLTEGVYLAKNFERNTDGYTTGRSASAAQIVPISIAAASCAASCVTLGVSFKIFGQVHAFC
jgi:hypothetical protein